MLQHFTSGLNHSFSRSSSVLGLWKLQSDESHCIKQISQQVLLMFLGFHALTFWIVVPCSRVNFRETLPASFGLSQFGEKNSLFTEKKGGKKKWLLTENLGENRSQTRPDNLSCKRAVITVVLSRNSCCTQPAAWP